MPNSEHIFQIPTPILSISKITTILKGKFFKDATISKHEEKLTSLLNSPTPKLPIYFHSKDIEKKLESKSSKIEFIYCARQGKTFDGHTLAKKVLECGNIFVGEKQCIQKIFPNEYESILNHPYFIPVLKVETILQTLLKSAYKIEEKNFFTIAVTGTNGKTSVTQMAGLLWHELTHENILKIGTLGVQLGKQTLPVSHVTTPDYPFFLSILGAAQEHKAKNIILEFTSHGLKEKRLENWPVNIAVFTNLTQDHLDFHKTMSDYRNSKLKLFKNHLIPHGTAIININNTEYSHFIEASKGQNINLILIGDSKNRKQIIQKYHSFFQSIKFIYIKNLVSNLEGIKGTILLLNEQEKVIEENYFTSPLIGDFQSENILCTIAIGTALKKALNKICQILPKIQTIPGRLEKIDFPSDNNLPTILIDYAHSPDALEKAIITCKNNLPKNGKLITVFGCGGDRDKLKRPLMGKIAFDNSNIVIVTSDNPRTEKPEQIIFDIFGEIKQNELRLSETDRKKAIQKAITLASKNDVILIAGKGHEDYQIIGTTKHPFSDSLVVKSILENRVF